MARGIFTLKQQLQGVREKSWIVPVSTYAASFNGSGQYLTTTNATAFSFGSGNWTIECWVNFNGLTDGNGDALVCIGDSTDSTGNRPINFYRASSNQIFIDLCPTTYSASFTQIPFNVTLTPGTWYHIAAVRNNNVIYCYVNGTSIGTPTAYSSTFPSYTGTVYIGRIPWNSASDLLGQLSNVRIIKGSAIYTQNFAPPISPLLAITNTQLLTLQNTTIVDNSANAFTLTNVGSIATFTAVPFTQFKTPAVDYLVVAGGGGGENDQGGGGGAGGLLQGSIPVITQSAITVTVGAGGTATSGQGTPATSGGNSVFSTITATGGGRGGDCVSTTPAIGGSGGGGGGYYAIGQQFGANGITGQGNSGGIGLSSGGNNNRPSGGGGGAGTVGANATSAASGNGGAGIASDITGIRTVYAGGGGGGMGQDGGTAGIGGAGGGGAGGKDPGNGVAGTINTGGGGGGCGNGASYNGGAGGSGIVILSYPDTYAAAAATTGNPVVSTSGSGSLTGNSLTASTGRFNYAGQTPFSFGTGDFTIEFWAYFTNTSAAANYLIDFRGASAPTGSVFGIYQNSSGLRYFSGAVGDYGFMGVPTQNVWYSVAATRVSGTVRLFVNGTLNTTFTDSSSYSVGNTGPSIMSSSYYNDYAFNGYISNFRIIKGTGLYTASYTPSTTPLTAISGTSLLLNTVSGAYFADGSANSFSPTVTNTMAWNQASPFATGLGYKNRVYSYTSSGSITF